MATKCSGSSEFSGFEVVVVASRDDVARLEVLIKPTAPDPLLGAIQRLLEDQA